MNYIPAETRYDSMKYRRCGRSGLMLPAISLGLWHNFGNEDSFENGKALIRRAFDLGITHFDLANNYGPPAGAAEENFGKILRQDFENYRDEMVISTKAGHLMWPGPYGDWGSKKYLTASLDQSLRRMGLDYVDIFYHHRPDPNTPLEETIRTLDLLVKQGKALYVGISKYSAEQTKQAIDMFKSLGTPFIIHQTPYSMFDRKAEEELLDLLEQEGIGTIVFKPLYQGVLTDKYLNGIPKDSRAAGNSIFLKKEDITEDKLQKVKKLNEIAKKRNQTLAQMALAWVLRKNVVTSALIGASRIEQIEDNIEALKNLEFSKEEFDNIEKIIS
ncbi:L-glyceraldehyde 3-phosphate reductase [Clostridium sp. YIM B02515]|uniref:L-glyceraldehyde 3-phosphate reductase n=1 Tax=Clostridium rhizosphaerae TaxID=2803861 RepID=A0ABS1T8Q2_9CLOT|nr:L-glyceraldehyde 3-phosphate reductase [Clostridium rhizosphaerae]MBL4935680.1 L-glyceraldehyde 3-phosphate reductase [Clostridium rhizosphaerae]